MLEEKVSTDYFFNILQQFSLTSEEQEEVLKIKKYIHDMEGIIFPEPKDPLVIEWINKGWIK
ncbi:MAG: hypothetical protein J6V44_03440 [Methanobrevibacter sp.]|nr:hypothetical protein [Methanobrevibacter sp.]